MAPLLFAAAIKMAVRNRHNGAASRVSMDPFEPFPPVRCEVSLIVFEQTAKGKRVKDGRLLVCEKVSFFKMTVFFRRFCLSFDRILF